MRYNLQRTRQSALVINIVCCLLFVCIGFVYLYYFQGDMMYMAQHVYSYGRTVYLTGFYSFLIIATLTLLGVAFAHYVYLPIRAKALFWFPSFLVLGLLTNQHVPIIDSSNSIVSGLWVIVILFVYALLFLAAHSYNDNHSENSSLPNLLWPNLFILFMEVSFMGMIGNTDKQLHIELRMEHNIAKGNFDEVIQECQQQPQLTRIMTAMRTYALSQKGELGDCLFDYTTLSGSQDLLPSLVDSIRPYNMPQILREYFGGFPLHDMSTTNYFRYLTQDSLCVQPARDYLLCALLLDRNINEFADSLISFYYPKDSIAEQRPASNKKSNAAPKPLVFHELPRNYAEALVLYSSTSDVPKAVLDSCQITENYNAFAKFRSDKGNALSSIISQSAFRQSYWYYYYYTK